VAVDHAIARADVISQRNVLVAVSLVLGSAVIIAGHSVFAGAYWPSVVGTVFAFALLIGACGRATIALQSRRGADGPAYQMAVGGVIALALSLAVAWLGPSADSPSLPTGYVAVTYHSVNGDGATCATVTQKGSLLQLVQRDGRIILVPNDSIIDMIKTADCG
jgi:hypothetical protein